MNVSALMDRLPLEQLDSLRAEWSSNRRLRVGLLAIWSLLLLYVVLVLSDSAAAAREELVDVDRRRDRLQAIIGQQYWLDRSERSAAALAELQTTFPTVASSGRAEAQVRSMLEKAIQDSGSRKLRLNMKSPESLQDGKMWRISATVSGVVPGDIARDFLADVETGANYGSIERLRLVRGLTAKKVRIEVDMQYLFRVEQG